MTEGLRFDRDGPLVTATIDRPPGNRLSVAMCEELTQLLLVPSPGLHVLHLRSHGEAFCLGRDRAADEPEALRSEVRALVGLNRALRSSPLVSVAEVQGPTAGFGVGLAALCDVTVAADTASFWFPEVEIELAPTVVLTWLAPAIGRKRAFWLTATGTRLGAAEAVTLGLVTQAVRPHTLADTVRRTAEQLQAFSPRVHGRIKRHLDATAGMTEEQAYALATEGLIVGSLQRTRDDDR
jgi:methylglutaconyl-CoA hydratase